MSIPIVFIHKGYSDYMEYSLRQAKYTNPDSEVILLGDEATENRWDFITHVNIKDYYNEAGNFAKIYKHCSTNPYNYELFCFQRWFALHEYIKAGKLKEAFVCDSDVLLFANITNVIRTNYQEIDFGCLWDYQNRGHNAAISYWTKIVLSEFCDNIVSLYSERDNLSKIKKVWDAVLDSGKPGSFSDMDAVENFVNKSNNFLIINFCKIYNDSVFDNNINESNCLCDNEYEFKKGVKNISWQNNMPFCYNNIYKEYTKFNCLHLQGPAKYLIKKFYTGPKFKGKIELDIKFFFANIAAYLYKKFKLRYWLVYILGKLNRR